MTYDVCHFLVDGFGKYSSLINRVVLENQIIEPITEQKNWIAGEIDSLVIAYAIKKMFWLDSDYI